MRRARQLARQLAGQPEQLVEREEQSVPPAEKPL
jgi:hypothetical protein